MDIRFSVHNTHLKGIDYFLENDPQLRSLKQQAYVYHSPIIEQLPMNIPGIYTLGGGRQIGKTTLLKQWMAKLLSVAVDPLSIAFFSGELIDDSHQLLNVLQTQLGEMPQDSMRYLILDEVTYIRDWDQAVKYAADAGMLEKTELILTGSDLSVIKEARTTFPGRRGKADVVDFHLYSLSFREVFLMKKNIKEISTDHLTEEQIDQLFVEFKNYLQHGGYLTAINELAADEKISIATLNTYSDWIRGDVLKRKKNENYLREILMAIIKRYNTQLSWNALARDLSIDHPITVADYVTLLESMDALFIQSALLEDKLTAAPKKAKKIMFTDPFIFHSIRAWLWPVNNPYQEQILTAVNESDLSSKLVEASVTTQIRRFYPTYYIKAEGEVDIAYIKDNKFWPIEIKWTNQLRVKDLKQISKYNNGLILTKSREGNIIQNVKTKPLPMALLEMEST